MKVTLKQFLEIVGEDFIETYLANLYIDEWDEDYQEWFSKIKIENIKNISELNPYMDYEINAFHQTVCYGEIDRQDIYVRKINEQYMKIMQNGE